MTTALPIEVILASKSPTRARLLTDAGVRFDAVSPGVDETAAKESFLAEGTKPRDIADALAEMKAVRVSMKREGLVIGADQTAELDGRLIDKAETIEEARAQLIALRGRTHSLHSAVVVARAGSPIWREVKTAKLTARAFSDAFLEDYLAREAPHIIGSVGCYRLEGEGAQLFERVEGDYFTVLGLPLLGLLDILRRHGALAT